MVPAPLSGEWDRTTCGERSRTMPKCYTQPFIIVGAIVEDNGKVLLVKEAKEIARGLWNQPAGWLDVGEDIITAVKREVKEETGLNFEPKKVLGIYSKVKRNHPVLKTDIHPVKIIFSGEIIGEMKISFDPDEILEAKWFTLGELEKMREQLRDENIIDEVKDCLVGKGYPLEIIHHMVSDKSKEK